MRALLQSIARQRRLSACVKWIAAVVVLGSAPTAFAQFDGESSYDAHGVLWTPWNPDDWTRRFRIGAVVGFNINAKFNMNGSAFGVSGNNPANGVYDDGYVHKDDTGSTDGFTSNWGYNNASQYNAGANTMSFHTVDSFSATDSGSANAGIVPGIDLAYSAYLWNSRYLNIGWELGFDWMPITISENNTISGDVVESTYVYDTGGIVIPDPPYQGGPSGTGPLLPIDHHPATTTPSIPATITGSRTLDVNLYIFRLGPTFNLNAGKNFSFTVGVGPALGLVDGALQFNENIIITPPTSSSIPASSTKNKGEIGSTELVYGGYVNVTCLYHLPNSDGRADLYLSTQYMPLSSATFKGGGRESKLELGGQVSISIGVNWPF